MVIWVHGLGGGPGAWEKPADKTEAGGATNYPARKVRSNRPTYSEGSTLVAAGNGLNSAISDFALVQNALGNVLPSDQTFIIAHSQGGLVSRAAGSIGTGGTLFDGIVTFGSPHGGALISNNLLAAGAFANQFCFDVLAGPNNSGILLPLTVFGSTVGEICGQIPAKLAGTFGKPILADYAVGAPGVTGLGGGNVNHKIVFAGVETEEVLWRELFHIVQPAADKPIFGANDQAAGQAAADKLKKYWDKTGNFYYWLNYYKLAALWYRGRRAISDANAKWKILMGGMTVTQVSTPGCACTPYNSMGQPTDITTFTPGTGGCTTWTGGPNGSYTLCVGTTAVVINTIQTPNDGVVTQPSAIAYPGAAMGINLIGSNHQSMRNDVNTRTSLLSVFKGEVGVETWFKTPVR